MTGSPVRGPRTNHGRLTAHIDESTEATRPLAIGTSDRSSPLHIALILRWILDVSQMLLSAGYALAEDSTA
jgi:hypothetical protein